MNLKWSKLSSRIFYSTDVLGGGMGKAVKILIHRWLVFWVRFPVEATLFLGILNPSMSILYKNARKIIFMLFRKNSNECMMIVITAKSAGNARTDVGDTFELISCQGNSSMFCTVRTGSYCAILSDFDCHSSYCNKWVAQDSMEMFTLCNYNKIINSYHAHYE